MIDDKYLHTECTAVPHGEDVSMPARMMLEHLIRDKPYGIAANQIGFNKRIIVINASNINELIINPVIVWARGLRKKKKESCLSFPGVSLKVMRWPRCRITGFNIHWNPIDLKLSGMPARVAQHEVDHINGVTMYDRAC